MSSSPSSPSPKLTCDAPFTINDLHGSTNAVDAADPFYLTTAINYTNGPPHCGHAYEAVLSDVFARYQRLCGREVFFLTGSDEHGQKIANGAEAANVTPKEYCDAWAEQFQALNRRLLISNDSYIRTTDPRHHQTCRDLWNKCLQNGDIYLADYTGWYNIREEMFVTDKDAEASGFIDEASGVPLRKVSEQCYFFRLSAYLDTILGHIEENPNFIQPAPCRTLVVDMLKKGGPDLCISRSSFTWGVPVPDGGCTGEDHVMYVWFDALTNYLSALEGEKDRKHFWPADVQVVGKDIVRFHCIYWPAMLMSAGLELPKRILAHGFVNDVAGRKMSKSIGNVICPKEVLCVLPPDTLRYHFCSEVICGGDLKLAVPQLLATHNQVLADTVGNLFQRAALLTAKYCSGVVPEMSPEVSFALDVPRVVAQYRDSFANDDQKGALQTAMEEARSLNKWLTDMAPWRLEVGSALQAGVVRVLLEGVYVLCHLLAPFMPLTASATFAKLNTPGTTFSVLERKKTFLVAGTELDKDPIWRSSEEKTLFPKIDVEVEEKGDKKKQKEKKEKKENKKQKQKNKTKQTVVAA